MKTLISNKTVVLQLPRSFALRNEIAAAGITNLHRAVVAALGVCWQGSGRPSTRYETSYSPLIYGAAVTDELTARGIPWAEIFAAGVVAYTYVCDSLPRENEVARIEGNSEDGVAPSSEAPNHPTAAA